MRTGLPGSVRAGVEALLERHFGRSVRITEVRSVGGGCINPSARLETDAGEAFFIKWNASAPPEMFEAEADGLRALAGAGALRVPEVLGGGGEGGRADPAWLLLEFVPPHPPGPDFGERFGTALAALHAPRDEGYGWHRDNFIGSLPQANPVLESWVDFWREARLLPQLHRARDQGHFTGADGRVLDRLLERLPVLLAGAQEDGPSLLHGDLWSGNVYAGPAGEPLLIDPAVYRGHREVDLAMLELFGGLPGGFRRAYEEVRPLSPGYDRPRRDVYQLYYLLVHVNLFGAAYVTGTMAAAHRALDAAG